MLAVILSLFSCSENETPDEEKAPEMIPEQVEDTYNYIALKNDGTLFTIGNKTGKVGQIARIPGIEFNIMFNSVTSSGSKIYIYEHRFDPPRGTLYVWDRQSGKSSSAVLEYPEEFGENTALMSLDWDEENQELVGITREDLEHSHNYKPIRIVRIDPGNFELTVSGDIDLSTGSYANIYSTNLVGQKLYAVALKNTNSNPDLLEINLDQNSFEVLTVSGTGSGITNLGNSGDPKTLFGLAPVANSNIMAEVRPVIYYIESGAVSELSEVPRISALNISHKTFYNEEGKEFAELVGFNNAVMLFRYNPSKDEFHLVKIPNPENLSSLISIIGVEKI